MTARARILYDGECRFCVKQAERLGRLVGDRAELETLQSAMPGPVPDEMKLVNGGRTYGGAEAVIRTLGLRPLFRPLVWIYLVPGLRQLMNAGYRWVAARRYRIAGRDCEDGRCRAHGRGNGRS